MFTIFAAAQIVFKEVCNFGNLKTVPASGTVLLLFSKNHQMIFREKETKA